MGKGYHVTTVHQHP